MEEKNTKKDSKRDIAIDVIKGLGIFCMVSGHCGAPYTHFIYLFHMAIFFIASGYCYKDKYSDDTSNFWEFTKRKFKTLWFPYVLWTVIFTLLNNFFININVYTNNKELLNLVSGQYIGVKEFLTFKAMLINIIKAILLHGGTEIGGAFWFLATLMQISILYCLIDWILKHFLNKKRILFIQGIISAILLLLGFTCSIKGLSIFGIEKVLSYYCLFYIGYIFKQFNISNKERNIKLHIVILVACMAILLVLNQIGSIGLADNHYINPIFFIIASCAGWQFLYEIALLLIKVNILKKIWVTIGQNTLSVVILHFLCFKIISYIQVIIMNKPHFLVAAFPVLYSDGLWWIAYLVIGLVIPISLNILRKLLVNKIVLAYNHKAKNKL